MNIDLYEKIEAYIQGRLSDDEHQQFEKDIAQNNELKEVLSIHEAAIAATAETDVIALRQQLSDLFKKKEDEEPELDLPPDGTARGFKPWWLLGLLPVAALLIWWFVASEKTEALPLPSSDPVPTQTEQAPLPPPPPNVPFAEAENDKTPAVPTTATDDGNNQAAASPTPVANNEYLALAEANFPRPEGVLIRSGASDEKNKLEQARDAYNQGVATSDAERRQAYFSNSITLLEEVENTQLIPAQYLRAHAYFQIGEYQKAAADFGALSDDFEYGYNADWGHLLVLIAQGPPQKEAYTQVLQKMTEDTNHPFQQKALDLQDELKRLEE